METATRRRKTRLAPLVAPLLLLERFDDCPVKAVAVAEAMRQIIGREVAGIGTLEFASGQ